MFKRFDTIPQSHVKTSSGPIEYKSNKHRILLVGDDTDVVEALRRGLKVKGCRSMLTLLRKKRWNHSSQTYMIYDLAILDIHMPAMTGFQLYREMKKVDSAITACILSAFEIYPDKFKKVFPSMNGVETVIKSPIN